MIFLQPRPSISVRTTSNPPSRSCDSICHCAMVGAANQRRPRLTSSIAAIPPRTSPQRTLLDLFGSATPERFVHRLRFSTVGRTGDSFPVFSPPSAHGSIGSGSAIVPREGMPPAEFLLRKTDLRLIAPLMELIFFPVGILFVVLLSVLAFGLWIWALVDCAVNESSEGNDKIVWILIIVFANWIGALLYLIVRRPRRIQEQRHSSILPPAQRHRPDADNPPPPQEPPSGH